MKANYWLIACLALLGLFLVTSCDNVRPGTIEDIEASAVVKLSAGRGHGSGVHIGNGLILTAAHVAVAAEKFTVKNDRGVEQEGEVLWLDRKRDVALIKVAKPELLAASQLSCREPYEGEHLTAKGNPMSEEFISLQGTVAGRARQTGPWKNVNPMDMTLAPGISGGPVYDDMGRVVGLALGVALAPLSPTASSMVGIGYIVPGNTICELLARTV